MKAPDGGIMGVYSTSSAKPFKERGTAASYQDWKFAYSPTTKALKKPAVPPGSSTAKPTPGQAAPGAR